MELEVGLVYKGFKLKKEENINGIKSFVRVFEHIKSGARLVSIKNIDEEKMFAIGFRTPPSDSTGVAHILEHSVLCGSKKFRTKSPFSDIGKSSLNTFLDAMTYSDRTLYPVGSKNDRDFMNLMNVYLDAVFNPRIYENHNILKEEGWRYELNEWGDIEYKGVVYSEMLGSLSSPEETIGNMIYKSIFPGTSYQYVSGGDPDVIPELTQEKLEKFHSTFYHPSNSYIYLYGNHDLLKCLEFIDREYLSSYTRTYIDSEIRDTIVFNGMVKSTGKYSIGENEDKKSKSLFALNFAYGNTSDPLDYLTHEILYNLLIESQSSPIKNALLQEGIGECLVTANDMNIDPSKEIVMPIVIKNANSSDGDRFKDIVMDVLLSLSKEGIDRKQLEASINTIEFRLKEMTEEKGFDYAELVMDSWIYDGDPLNHLRYKNSLRELKRKIEKGYFEDFIRDNMVNNKHCSFVALYPERGLEAKKTEEIKEKLKSYRNQLSDEEFKRLAKDNEELRKEQMSEDSKEDKKTIPRLSLNMVDREVEEIHKGIISHNGIDFLNHEVFTGGIEYIDILFDASDIREDEVKYLSLLEDMLSLLDTENRSYLDLATEIARVTGGIDFNTNVYIPRNNTKDYKVKFIASTKATGDNIEKSIKLLNEVLTLTKFDNIKRIGEIIKEVKAKLQHEIIDDFGHYGVLRTESMYSVGSAYKEQLEGISYYRFVCDIDKGFPENGEEISRKLKNVYKRIVNRKNLIISMTGEKEENFRTLCNREALFNGISNRDINSRAIDFRHNEKSEGIITNSSVQYVAKSYNSSKLGYEYSGKMLVMANVIENDYLYKRVRQGGAYSCYPFVDCSGNMGVFSYRDPNLTRTLDVYSDIYKFLDSVNLTNRDLEDFIIGTIGKRYMPLTPIQKARKSTSDYICGVSIDDNQNEKDEIFSTTIEDIKSYTELMKGIMNRGNCCVLGNGTKIMNNKEIFNDIIRL